MSEGSSQSIEDVPVLEALWQHYHERFGDEPLYDAEATLDYLEAEGFAVIRLDPELAFELLGWSCRYYLECGHPDCNMLRRAARIIGGEQSDE